jgi:hypothetical protein
VGGAERGSAPSHADRQRKRSIRNSSHGGGKNSGAHRGASCGGNCCRGGRRRPSRGKKVLGVYKRRVRRNKKRLALTGSSTTEKDSEPKNLGAVFDAHVRAEFVEKDVAATMATMTAEPYLTHVPTMTGGTGRAEVDSFYHDHFVGFWPDDVQVKSISRTVGQNRVSDELIVSFTHDREMRSFFPAWRRPVARLCYRMWW